MKIFNWVHRKFHRNNVNSSSIHKDGFCGDQMTIEKVAIGTQALLGQEVALVGMLGGWNDGLLTIGTLGFDEPLKSFPCNYNEIEEVHDDVDDEDEEDHEEQEADEREDDEEGEHYPLVLKASTDSLKEGICPLLEVITDCERPGKKNGERTTLADLFSADCDDDDVKREPVHPCEVLPKSKSSSLGHAGKKQALRSTKNGLSFAKKLIPRVGDDSRSIKKLNQLMTRMLKRKIHPELEGKISKSDDGLLSSDELGANEEVSLLQTQVVAN